MVAPDMALKMKGRTEAEYMSLRAEVSHNGHGVNFNNQNHLWHTSGLMKVILSVQILLLEVGNKSISVSLDELKIIQKCLNAGDGKRTPLYNVARHTNMMSIVGRGYHDI